MPLDTFVSQIAFRTRLLERAVHDAGPWTIRFESGPSQLEMPAAKALLADGVHFHAHFPPMIQMEGWFHLCLRGESYSSRVMATQDHDFTINWVLRGVMDDYQHSPGD
jgi:hypothetical protein